MQKEFNVNMLKDLIADIYSIVSGIAVVDEERFTLLRRLLFNFERDPLWWNAKIGIRGANSVVNLDFDQELLSLNVNDRRVAFYLNLREIEDRVYNLVHSEYINNLPIPEYIINGMIMISDEARDLFLEIENSCEIPTSCAQNLSANFRINVEIF